MAPANRQLLTPRDVAERLQINEDVVRRWLREGRLTGVLLGRLWRVTEEALAQFIASNTRRKGEGLEAQEDGKA